jgi:hypothetical protein
LNRQKHYIYKKVNQKMIMEPCTQKATEPLPAKPAVVNELPKQPTFICTTQIKNLRGNLEITIRLNGNSPAGLLEQAESDTLALLSDKVLAKLAKLPAVIDYKAAQAKLLGIVAELKPALELKDKTAEALREELSSELQGVSLAKALSSRERARQEAIKLYRECEAGLRVASDDCERLKKEALAAIGAHVQLVVTEELTSAQAGQATVEQSIAAALADSGLLNNLLLSNATQNSIQIHRYAPAPGAIAQLVTQRLTSPEPLPASEPAKKGKPINV